MNSTIFFDGNIATCVYLLGILRIMQVVRFSKPLSIFHKSISKLESKLAELEISMRKESVEKCKLITHYNYHHYWPN